MSRPLRIAFLDSWKPSAFDGSGTAVGISGLALALRSLGNEVSLVRPDRSGGALPARLIFNLRLPRQLSRRRRYDLIAGFDLDGFRWARAPSRRIPYVVCLKGIAADEARFSTSTGERVLLSTLGRLERMNARGADLVVVPSRYSAEVAREHYGISHGRIRVVPEAVDLGPWEALRARADGLPPRLARRPIILSVARQYPRKDTATLLRAMRLVLETHSNALLTIIGGGPELPRLKRLSTELDLDGAVLFRGEIREDAEVRAAFSEADVFCLPSRQEGFGIVFVEAMAAGLPVVAARAGAVPEIVEHDKTGLLVPPMDPRALSSALIHLLGSREARSRLGMAGVRSAQEHGLEAVGERFLAAIEPLLPSQP